MILFPVTTNRFFPCVPLKIPVRYFICSSFLLLSNGLFKGVLRELWKKHFNPRSVVKKKGSNKSDPYEFKPVSLFMFKLIEQPQLKSIVS
jgi:hypothetical protein